MLLQISKNCNLYIKIFSSALGHKWHIRVFESWENERIRQKRIISIKRQFLILWHTMYGVKKRVFMQSCHSSVCLKRLIYCFNHGWLRNSVFHIAISLIIYRSTPISQIKRQVILSFPFWRVNNRNRFLYPPFYTTRSYGLTHWST